METTNPCFTNQTVMSFNSPPTHRFQFEGPDGRRLILDFGKGTASFEGTWDDAARLLVDHVQIIMGDLHGRRQV